MQLFRLAERDYLTKIKIIFDVLNPHIMYTRSVMRAVSHKLSRQHTHLQSDPETFFIKLVDHFTKLYCKRGEKHDVVGEAEIGKTFIPSSLLLPATTQLPIDLFQGRGEFRREWIALLNPLCMGEDSPVICNLNAAVLLR